MRLAALVELFRVWGTAALMVFPAHRRLREVEAENAELRLRYRTVDAELATTASACEMLAQSAVRARTTL